MYFYVRRDLKRAHKIIWRLQLELDRQAPVTVLTVQFKALTLKTLIGHVIVFYLPLCTNNNEMKSNHLLDFNYNGILIGLIRRVIERPVALYSFSD